MATTDIKSLRLRTNDEELAKLLKHDAPGAGDVKLVLKLDGKDRVVAVYRGNTTSLSSNFTATYYYKKDYKEKSDDEIIQRYLNNYPKWQIIQDPYDPNIIPPDKNFKKASSGNTYTADVTMSQESAFLTRNDNKTEVDSGKLSVKSYTFQIKNPKNKDEKKVKLIIWIIDLNSSEYVKNLPLDVRRVFAGTTKESRDLLVALQVPYPTEGNYMAISKFTGIPSVSPKDGTGTNIKVAEEEYSPGGVAFLCLLEAKDENAAPSNNQYTGALDNVNDYIDYIIYTNKFKYQLNVYNVVFQSERERSNFDKPENKIEFIQSAQSSQEEVKPDPVEESTTAPTETIAPLFSPDKIFTFNVEKSGLVSNPELGTFSIVDVTPEFQFSNALEETPIDAEYTESGFTGDDELPDEISFETVDVSSLNDVKGFDPENPNETLSTDTSSEYPLSKDKDANARSIIKAAKSSGVTNKFTIAAILAIVSKESGFVPRSEASYSGTSAARIKKIFGRFKKYSDSEVDVIKKDPVKFFDIIYGGKYENASNEGYKYRGRGFNQITFKSNYRTYKTETGIDIVSDPDLLNTVDVAAKCVVAYFKRNVKNAPSDIRKRYNFSDINSFKNLDDAVGAIYHANAGWGKSYSEIVADSTGGRKKAFDKAGPLYNTYKDAL